MARERLTILHDDADCVAVEKPAGLATIPGRGEDDSLLERLGRQLGIPSSGTADPRLRVVHRLDKDTSGVVLFAKHVAAQRALSEQFQQGRVQKEYLALVAGAPPSADGEIDAPLAPHPRSPKHMSVAKHGRPARTIWRLDQRLGPFALLRVFPQTGRTHQIRVHLAHVGLPLAIDPLYNASGPAAIYLSQFKRGYRISRDESERPLIERLTLHAERLSFAHPTDNRSATKCIECPPPKDFRAALKMLLKYALGRTC